MVNETLGQPDSWSTRLLFNQTFGQPDSWSTRNLKINALQQIITLNLLFEKENHINCVPATSVIIIF